MDMPTDRRADKRTEPRRRVKARITRALFDLMEEQPLADIHITQLVERAGVGRASFYRNYTSKEDVLVTLLRDILDQYAAEAELTQTSFYTYENVLLSFRYFQHYRAYLLNLYRSGFLSVVLEELNAFHERMAGSMPAASIQRYQLYFYIGALLNTVMVWLAEDQKTPPEEMARFFLAATQGTLSATDPAVYPRPDGAGS